MEDPKEVSLHCLHFGLPHHLPLSSEAEKAKMRMIRMGRTYIVYMKYIFSWQKKCEGIVRYCLKVSLGLHICFSPKLARKGVYRMLIAHLQVGE